MAGGGAAGARTAPGRCAPAALDQTGVLGGLCVDRAATREMPSPMSGANPAWPGPQPSARTRPTGRQPRGSGWCSQGATHPPSQARHVQESLRSNRRDALCHPVPGRTAERSPPISREATRDQASKDTKVGARAWVWFEPRDPGGDGHAAMRQLALCVQSSPCTRLPGSSLCSPRRSPVTCPGAGAASSAVTAARLRWCAGRPRGPPRGTG